MAMTQSVIECRKLSKTFALIDEGEAWRLLFRGGVPDRGFEALHEVSLAVPKGEFVGLLGRNGAGKSTLLRMIGGVYPSSGGVVRVGGPLSGLYELGVMGNELLTGRRFTSRWLSFQGLKDRTLETALDEVAEFSELDEYFGRPIFMYSTGMRARLYFAVATALPGQIYLIDEVLTVGDEHFQAKSWRRLRERLTHGASGLLATHDWSAVLKLCRETYLLDRGRVVDHGPSRKVVQRYLDLPMPKADAACFAPSLPGTFHAVSGQDATFTVPIEVAAEEPVHFRCSIEHFCRGAGWNHLLHAEGTEVARRPGHYMVEMRIPELPLASGEYSLNLFLTRPIDPGARTAETLDVRSWTYGNDVTLVVEGTPCDGVAVLPLRWRLTGG